MDHLSPSAPILLLVVLPQLLHALPQDLREEVVAVPILHLGVELRREPRLEGVALVKEPRRDVVALVPPVALHRLHPVPRRVPGLEPHIVGDALDEAAVRPPPPVPLPHVRRLVVQHAGHLGPDVAGVAADVPGAQVDAVGAREGDAAGVLDDEGDRVHGLALGGAVLVEGAPDEGGRVGEDTPGVPEPDGLVEAPAADAAAARAKREATVAT
ncbi:hypothetical protein GQ55_9G200400 [Panicum hallii var. hallii]|uniref:Uncharacterized protein n=1 Tax=Panicum hallii var. hallii TaxID=1504633 RepID=A0A2T7C576_9POAL|nr:hypothetical protein GQ55_9G200400 [Panicum hallii var. hallii]